MKRVQQLHLWLGTLFAPLIIFFSLSGALQTLGLHEQEKSGGHTPAWIAEFASVHKDQQLAQGEGQRRRPPPGANPASGPNARRAGAPEGPRPEGESKGRGASPWPLKWFIVLMSLGLITTTALGIYMAFKYSRNKAVVWGLLAAGILLPLALLFL